MSRLVGMPGLVVLLLVACGSSEREEGESSAAGDGPAATAPTPGPIDALTRRFGRVRAAMRERGYDEVRPFGRRFVLERSGEAVPLDLPTDHCSTVVALGGGQLRDLQLILYDENGEEAAVDAVEREGGLVHVCPEGRAKTLPFYLVIEAHEGSGAVESALFQSDPVPGQGFAGVFDEALAPQVPFREAEELLAQSRAALRERGFVPLSSPHLEVVAEGEGLRRSEHFEADRCYVAVARSGNGLRDTDLFLYDPRGAEVARDLESNADPSLEHCPDEEGRYIIEARAFEGAGALGLMMLSRAKPEEPADAGASREPSTATPAENPMAALGGVTTDLANRGYEPVFVLRESTIMPGEARTHEVLLGPGCGLIVGVPGAAGMDLDLYLADGQDRPIDRDARVEPTARVSACPAETTVMHVTVKAYGRDAPYALTVMRAPEDIANVQALRLEEADAAYRARGYERRRVERVHMDHEDRVRRSFTLRSGQCAAMAVAGDEGVEDLDLFVRNASSGELVASESGPAPWVAVSRCSEEREPLEVEIVMSRGEGEVAFVRLEGTP